MTELLKSRLGYPWVYLTEHDQFSGELETGHLELLRVEPGELDSKTEHKLKRLQSAFDQARLGNGGIIPAHVKTSDMVRLVNEESNDHYSARLERKSRKGVAPIAAGIDTLYLSVDVQFSQPVLEMLEVLKEQSQEKRVRPIVQVGGHRLEVQPYGAKPFWRYVLKGSTFNIKIRRDYKSGSASAYIEIRSQWLWRNGADQVVADLTKLLDGWRVPDSPLTYTVSRLDLCVDVQGFVPCLQEYLSGAFVTRSRSHTAYMKNDPLVWSDEHHDKSNAIHFSGGRLQGLSFGKGAISCRIYDKQAEIKKSKKDWLKSIWTACGWDETKRVFRVEFQLRAEGLKCWLSESGGDFKKGKTWPEIRRAIDGIWSYLTGRVGKGWLSLKKPSSDSNRTRWPVSQAWGRIASLKWGGATKRARVVRVPEARFIPTPNWVSDLRAGHQVEKQPQARASIGSAIARIVTQDDVRKQCDKPTRDLWDGTVFKASEACLSPYLVEAEQRAEMLSHQAVGVGIAMAANLDEATGAFDPLTEDGAVERVLISMRSALRSKGGIKDRLILSKDRSVFRQAFEQNLRSLTG